ncbi:hypothetical protein GUJ93_ZPchr0011g28053 [Zizania palustris]|uniref:NAC domain-containing protein n=1 Tax=Zizania palustris TaxID=103762 RepID=A0A8J5WHY8_ZIZPA|nr:hypothetical protein GUJ93_ZPchr0011g28053 [Zizania palustris]
MVETTTRAVKSEKGSGLFLPPGFRFYPTDEEVVTSYLLQKFINPRFTSLPIGEVDLNKCEPWDLPSKATMGEKEWYFFCQKDMKYPTGMRTNRATKEGYWKATGKDREIFTGGKKQAGDEQPVGMKKTLVFYMGRAPKGTKTNWVMHEFRLHGSYHKDYPNLRVNPKHEWVVCKVFHNKGDEGKKQTHQAAVDSCSAGTPNNGSSVVEAAGDGGDEMFQLESIMDPSIYFSDDSAASSSLPANMAIAINNAMPYNAAYPVSTTNAASSMTTTSTTSAAASFQLPNYSLINTGINSCSNTAAPAHISYWNNTAPPVAGRVHGTGSYNLLHQAAGHDHQQAAMVKALEGIIGGQNYGVPSSSSRGLSSSARSATAGAWQQNSPGMLQQHKLQNYGHSHTYTWE